MKFEVGDRVRAIKKCSGSNILGKIGTVLKVSNCDVAVEFDEYIYGHTCGGRAKHGYGWWCRADLLEPVCDNGEIEVGKKYRVTDGACENGNVIEIVKIEGVYAHYKTIVGVNPSQSLFGLGSDFHKGLIPYVDNKIVITTDGKTTTAKLYDGKKFVKSAKAVCSPDDEFDFERGAGIAMSRLLEWDFVPADEVKETLLNTKICIIEGDEHLKTGHIYEIVDGKFQCDVIGNGKSSTFPMSFRLKSIDELEIYLSHKHNSNYSYFSTTPIKFIEVVE